MLCALLLLVLNGCARNRITPGEPRPDPIAVAGTGTISWSLLVLSWHRPDSYQYFAFVDGARVRLTDVRCERTNPTTQTCTAPLPPLRPGRHDIQLVTVDPVAGAESSRSGTIAVSVTAEPPANR
jgi:hypothetical protein